ncbi:hypothetical protein BDZ91DRAFT_719589 [Kalaharituber pfeilii]|nr:hypothetical protein BDZ91DRAFT_719589 [Kalaharituber pfeilii]
MSQKGNLTVYVPQLGASSPVTLLVPVGTSNQAINDRKDIASDIDRFLQGLPSEDQDVGSNHSSISPTQGNWILFDVERLTFIHRATLNIYMENLSPQFLEGKSYVLLSSQASFRFTRHTRCRTFLYAVFCVFPQKIPYRSVKDFLKHRAKIRCLPCAFMNPLQFLASVPFSGPRPTCVHDKDQALKFFNAKPLVAPWHDNPDAAPGGYPTMLAATPDRGQVSYYVALWIPGYALPWDVIIRSQSVQLNLEAAISNFLLCLRNDTTTSIKPIIPVFQDNWALVNFETQQVIPKIFVNNIALLVSKSETFILAPITLASMAIEFLEVIKDGGVPAWENYWKNYAALST